MTVHMYTCDEPPLVHPLNILRVCAVIVLREPLELIMSKGHTELCGALILLPMIILSLIQLIIVVRGHIPWAACNL